MTLRIGIVGAGRMGRTHADCLSQIPDAEIVAVCDVILERAHALAERTGAMTYRDYRQMLDDEKLDAAYICTPTGTHAEVAIAAAECRLPFFVEKPLALTMVDGWRIARAVEESGVLTCVGYHWRYSRAVRKAEEILADRPISLLSGEWLWTRPPIEWLRDRDLGGGQVVDQTTHLTDLCQLFGGPVTRVYAAFTLNTFSDTEFHNWDGYSLCFKHLRGAVGSLHCTYALFPEIATFEPPRLDLVARDMFLRITPDGLTVITPQGKEEFPNQGRFHFEVNRAFVSALEQRDPVQVRSSVGETLRSLALTLAANESARTGEPIDLDQFMQSACP